MKNNQWQLAMIAIIGLVILVAGGYVISGGFSGGNSTAAGNLTTPIANNTSVNLQETLAPLKLFKDGTPANTALCAYNVAIQDQEVSQWTSSKSNLSVVTISTDSSIDGISDTWKVVLSGSGASLAIYVDNGEVTKVVETQNGLGKDAALNLTRVLNSDEVWSKCGQATYGENESAPAVSMVLSKVGKESCWDLFVPAADGVKVTRVNAVTGEVMKTTALGGQ